MGKSLSKGKGNKKGNWVLLNIDKWDYEKFANKWERRGRYFFFDFIILG